MPLPAIDRKSVVWRVVYLEKRVSKHQIQNASLQNIISTAAGEGFAIANSGTVILGIAKIYMRKIRYVLDGCNALLGLVLGVSRRKKETKKKVVKPVDCGSTMLENESVAEEIEILPAEAYDYNDVMDFDDRTIDFSAVEVPRNEADQTETSQIQILNNEQRSKKRRIIDDSDIEIDIHVFKANIRRTKDILMQNTASSLAEILKDRLNIASEIMRKIQAPGIVPRESIEAVRADSIMDDFQSGYNGAFDSDHSSKILIDSSISEVTVEDQFFSIDRFPQKFVFNELVRGSSKAEKCRKFLSLVTLASEGKIRAMQDIPFSGIHCIKI